MTEKKQRSDSERNLAKVAAVVMKDPTKKQRDIAKEAGVSKGTVTNKLGQLGLVKSDFIQRVIARDAEIIELGQQIIHDKLSDDKYIKTLKPTEVSQVIKENTARYTLFKGDITDKDGGLKDPKDYTDEEIEAYLFSKKKGQQ